MLHRSLENELLLALIAASAGDMDDAKADALWVAFLDSLRQASEAESAWLHLALGNGSTRHWTAGAAPGPGLELDTVQRAQMRDNRIYAQIDLPGASSTQAPLRAVQWRVGSQGVGALILRRSGQDFRAVDSSRLSGLLPYLGPAQAIWLTLEDERTRAAIERQIGGALNTGWVALHPTGAVLHLNAKARALIEGSDHVLRQTTGMLAFSEAETAQKFRQALAVLRSGEAVKTCVELSQRPLLQMSLSPMRWLGEPVILGILRQEPSLRALDLAATARHFGLSRSETRLAALLCDGHSLKDAAAELGWTPESVRSCSKKIYAQMEVAGQTGVLRALLNSAVWFDPAT